MQSKIPITKGQKSKADFIEVTNVVAWESMTFDRRL